MFVESCIQRRCCALAYITLVVSDMYWRRYGVLLHTCLLQSGMYWRHGGVNQWDSLRVDLGFCQPFGGLTRESSDLGFGHRALPHMSLVVGGTQWRHGDKLLHICHSSWVAYTGVVMAIRSCMYVTRCGWHTPESWWHTPAKMSLVVGGMHWRLSRVLVCICRGWHVLKA